MKKLNILFIQLLTIVNLSTYARTSSIPYYSQQTGLMMSSSGAFGNGLAGYFNPALVNYLHGPEFMMLFSSKVNNFSNRNPWGLCYGIPNLSFGMIHSTTISEIDSSAKVNDYRISYGFGEDDFSIGLSYGWSSGDLKNIQRDKLITLGTIYRPNKFMSFGYSSNFAMGSDNRQDIFEMAVRPDGSDEVTIFGDFALQNTDSFENANWSAGFVAQIIPGIHITGRYFDSKSFSLGLSVSTGTQRLFSHINTPRKGEKDAIYGFRFGAKEFSFMDTHVLKEKKYVYLSFGGTIGYRKFRLFDDNKRTLISILADLQGVIDDPSVAGVAINLSGMRVTREIAWEIREKLKEVKAAKKKIIIYIDRAAITNYHLASIADQIIMDPEGMLVLEGYVMGRTFLKGALEKLGLGFDEWRFLKYKSANESYSQNQMSTADKEQREALLNDLYGIIKQDICVSRNMEETKLDELVNDRFIFLAQEAMDEGLVDHIGRWIDIKKYIEKLEGKKKLLVKSKWLANNTLPRRVWGPKPKIALIYALGECEMDTGIQARKLEALLTVLTKNRSIKAVVIRVDSPGGEPLASDLVAEAIKKCSKKKPVLVTQGNVAASGGYWLSMYADSIIAAPFTITGSIGVIGGWLWNEGFGEKLGLVSDHVKIGRHADLGFGITLPLIGLQVPDRNLTPEEREKFENMLRDSYRRFVDKVAKGRNMTFEDVDQVAQGRAWSGLEAKDHRLIDEIGGLETAIVLAKQAASIPEDQDIEIVELPKMDLFEFDSIMPRIVGVKTQKLIENYDIQYLRMLNRFQGQPLSITAPDYLPNDQINIESNSDYE